ncbi:tetratricopeptide repeat protein [bacterium]|nr:tetratricopeptide repeat protein [candidate division CSSED10-310 bacterium]
MRYRTIRQAVVILLCLFLGTACAHRNPGRRAAQLNGHAVHLAERQLWQEAEFYLERAVKTAHDDPRVLNNMAVLLEQKGNYEVAMALYNKALFLAPHSSVITHNLKALQAMLDDAGEKDAGDDKSR